MLLSLQALPPGLESSPRCRIFLNQDDMLEASKPTCGGDHRGPRCAWERQLPTPCAPPRSTAYLRETACF